MKYNYYIIKAEPNTCEDNMLKNGGCPPIVFCKYCTCGKPVFNEEEEVGFINCSLYGKKNPNGFCEMGSLENDG